MELKKKIQITLTSVIVFTICGGMCYFTGSLLRKASMGMMISLFCMIYPWINIKPINGKITQITIDEIDYAGNWIREVAVIEERYYPTLRRILNNKPVWMQGEEYEIGSDVIHVYTNFMDTMFYPIQNMEGVFSINGGAKMVQLSAKDKELMQKIISETTLNEYKI